MASILTWAKKWSKWFRNVFFSASFRTPSFVFLYDDQEPRSWAGGGGASKRPPTDVGKSRGPAGRGLTRALMGLWIFDHLLGRGCLNTSRLSRLLRIVEQNGKRCSKAREKSFRNHFGHFLAQVKIEVTRGQNSKIFQNGFWTIKSLILKVEQLFWYHCVCLVNTHGTMYNLTSKGQGQNLTTGQVRARSLGDSSRSNYTSFDASCGDKRNDSNATSLSHLVLKLLAKNCWWPRVTSKTFREGVTD